MSLSSPWYNEGGRVELSPDVWRQRFGERLGEVEQSLADLVASKADELGQLTHLVTADAALDEQRMRLDLLESCAAARDEAHSQLSRRLDDLSRSLDEQRRRQDEVDRYQVARPNAVDARGMEEGFRSLRSDVNRLTDELSISAADCQHLRSGFETSVAETAQIRSEVESVHAAQRKLRLDLDRCAAEFEQESKGRSVVRTDLEKYVADIHRQLEQKTTTICQDVQATIQKDKEDFCTEVKQLCAKFEDSLHTNFAIDMQTHLQGKAATICQDMQATMQKDKEDFCTEAQKLRVKLGDSLQAELLSDIQKQFQENVDQICKEVHTVIHKDKDQFCTEAKQLCTALEDSLQARITAAVEHRSGLDAAADRAIAIKSVVEKTCTDQQTLAGDLSKTKESIQSLDRERSELEKSIRHCVEEQGNIASQCAELRLGMRDVRDYIQQAEVLAQDMRDHADGQSNYLVKTDRSLEFADGKQILILQERIDNVEKMLGEYLTMVAALGQESHLSPRDRSSTRDIEAANQAREKMLAEVRRLSLESEDLRDWLCEAKREKDLLEESFQKLRLDVQHCGTNLVEVQNSVHAMANFEEDSSRIAKKQSELQADLHACCDEVELLKTGIGAASHERGRLHDDLTAFEAMIHQARDERTEITELHGAIRSEVEHCNEGVAAMRAAMHEAHVEWDQFSGDMERMLVKFQRLMTEGEALAAQQTELENRMRDAEAAHVVAEDRYAKLQAEIEASSQEVVDTKNRLAAGLAQVDMELRTAGSKLRADMDDRTNEVTRKLQSEIGRSVREMAEQEMQRLQTIAEEVKVELRTIASVLPKLKAELDCSSANADNLQSKVSQIQLASNSLSRSTSQTLDTFVHEFAEVRSGLAGCMAALSKVQQDCAVDATKRAELLERHERFVTETAHVKRECIAFAAEQAELNSEIASCASTISKTRNEHVTFAAKQIDLNSELEAGHQSLKQSACQLKLRSDLAQCSADVSSLGAELRSRLECCMAALSQLQEGRIADETQCAELLSGHVHHAADTARVREEFASLSSRQAELQSEIAYCSSAISRTRNEHETFASKQTNLNSELETGSLKQGARQLELRSRLEQCSADMSSLKTEMHSGLEDCMSELLQIRQGRTAADPQRGSLLSGQKKHGGRSVKEPQRAELLLGDTRVAADVVRVQEEYALFTAELAALHSEIACCTSAISHTRSEHEMFAAKQTDLNSELEAGQLSLKQNTSQHELRSRLDQCLAIVSSLKVEVHSGLEGCMSELSQQHENRIADETQRAELLSGHARHAADTARVQEECASCLSAQGTVKSELASCVSTISQIRNEYTTFATKQTGHHEELAELAGHQSLKQNESQLELRACFDQCSADVASLRAEVHSGLEGCMAAMLQTQESRIADETHRDELLSGNACQAADTIRIHEECACFATEQGKLRCELGACESEISQARKDRDNLEKYVHLTRESVFSKQAACHLELCSDLDQCSVELSSLKAEMHSRLDDCNKVLSQVQQDHIVDVTARAELFDGYSRFTAEIRHVQDEWTAFVTAQNAKAGSPELGDQEVELRSEVAHWSADVSAVRASLKRMEAELAEHKQSQNDTSTNISVEATEIASRASQLDEFQVELRSNALQCSNDLLQLKSGLLNVSEEQGCLHKEVTSFRSALEGTLRDYANLADQHAEIDSSLVRHQERSTEESIRLCVQLEHVDAQLNGAVSELSEKVSTIQELQLRADAERTMTSTGVPSEQSVEEFDRLVTEVDQTLSAFRETFEEGQMEMQSAFAQTNEAVAGELISVKETQMHMQTSMQDYLVHLEHMALEMGNKDAHWQAELENIVAQLQQLNAHCVSSAERLGKLELLLGSAPTGGARPNKPWDSPRQFAGDGRGSRASVSEPANAIPLLKRLEQLEQDVTEEKNKWNSTAEALLKQLESPLSQIRQELCVQHEFYVSMLGLPDQVEAQHVRVQKEIAEYIDKVNSNAQEVAALEARVELVLEAHAAQESATVAALEARVELVLEAHAAQENATKASSLELTEQREAQHLRLQGEIAEYAEKLQLTSQKLATLEARVEVVFEAHVAILEANKAHQDSTKASDLGLREQVEAQHLRFQEFIAEHVDKVNLNAQEVAALEARVEILLEAHAEHQSSTNNSITSISEAHKARQDACQRSVTDLQESVVSQQSRLTEQIQGLENHLREALHDVAAHGALLEELRGERMQESVEKERAKRKDVRYSESEASHQRFGDKHYANEAFTSTQSEQLRGVEKQVEALCSQLNSYSDVHRAHEAEIESLKIMIEQAVGAGEHSSKGMETSSVFSSSEVQDSQLSSVQLEQLTRLSKEMQVLRDQFESSAYTLRTHTIMIGELNKSFENICHDQARESESLDELKTEFLERIMEVIQSIPLRERSKGQTDSEVLLATPEDLQSSITAVATQHKLVYLERSLKDSQKEMQNLRMKIESESSTNKTRLSEIAELKQLLSQTNSDQERNSEYLNQRIEDAHRALDRQTALPDKVARLEQEVQTTMAKQLKHLEKTLGEVSAGYALETEGIHARLQNEMETRETHRVLLDALQAKIASHGSAKDFAYLQDKMETFERRLADLGSVEFAQELSALSILITEERAAREVLTSRIDGELANLERRLAEKGYGLQEASAQQEELQETRAQCDQLQQQVESISAQLKQVYATTTAQQQKLHGEVESLFAKTAEAGDTVCESMAEEVKAMQVERAELEQQHRDFRTDLASACSEAQVVHESIRAACEEQAQLHSDLSSFKVAIADIRATGIDRLQLDLENLEEQFARLAAVQAGLLASAEDVQKNILVTEKEFGHLRAEVETANLAFSGTKAAHTQLTKHHSALSPVVEAAQEAGDSSKQATQLLNEKKELTDELRAAAARHKELCEQYRSYCDHLDDVKQAMCELNYEKETIKIALPNVRSEVEQIKAETKSAINAEFDRFFTEVSLANNKLRDFSREREEGSDGWSCALASVRTAQEEMNTKYDGLISSLGRQLDEDRETYRRETAKIKQANSELLSTLTQKIDQEQSLRQTEAVEAKARQNKILSEIEQKIEEEHAARRAEARDMKAKLDEQCTELRHQVEQEENLRHSEVNGMKTRHDKLYSDLVQMVEDEQKARRAEAKEEQNSRRAEEKALRAKLDEIMTTFGQKIEEEQATRQNEVKTMKAKHDELSSGLRERIDQSISLDDSLEITARQDQLWSEVRQQINDERDARRDEVKEMRNGIVASLVQKIEEEQKTRHSEVQAMKARHDELSSGIRQKLDQTISLDVSLEMKARQDKLWSEVRQQVNNEVDARRAEVKEMRNSIMASLVQKIEEEQTTRHNEVQAMKARHDELSSGIRQKIEQSIRLDESLDMKARHDKLWSDVRQQIDDERDARRVELKEIRDRIDGILPSLGQKIQEEQNSRHSGLKAMQAKYDEHTSCFRKKLEQCLSIDDSVEIKARQDKISSEVRRQIDDERDARRAEVKDIRERIHQFLQKLDQYQASCRDEVNSHREQILMRLDEKLHAEHQSWHNAALDLMARVDKETLTREGMEERVIQRAGEVVNDAQSRLALAEEHTAEIIKASEKQAQSIETLVQLAAAAKGDAATAQVVAEKVRVEWAKQVKELQDRLDELSASRREETGDGSAACDSESVPKDDLAHYDSRFSRFAQALEEEQQMRQDAIIGLVRQLEYEQKLRDEAIQRESSARKDIANELANKIEALNEIFSPEDSAELHLLGVQVRQLRENEMQTLTNDAATMQKRMESKLNALAEALHGRCTTENNTPFEEQVRKEVEARVIEGDRKWVQETLEHEAAVQESARAQLVETLQGNLQSHTETWVKQEIEDMRAQIEASMASVQALQFQEGLQALRQQLRDELRAELREEANSSGKERTPTAVPGMAPALVHPQLGLLDPAIIAAAGELLRENSATAASPASSSAPGTSPSALRSLWTAWGGAASANAMATELRGIS